MTIDAANNSLQERTKQFALRIVRLTSSLPSSRSERVIGGQLIRCGTSVGANYRAACRARSPAEFRAKLGIAEEEADESIYWMELLIAAEIVPFERLENLIQEANDILSMVKASIKTSKANQKGKD